MPDTPARPPMRLITMEEFVAFKPTRPKRRPPRLVDAEQYIALGKRPKRRPSK